MARETLRISLPYMPRTGGGSSFLSLLQLELENRGQYSSSLDHCHFAVINSHHWFRNILSLLRLKYQHGLRVVIRIDGPLLVYRRTFHSYILDLAIHTFGFFVAEAYIYQSFWSRSRNHLFYPWSLLKKNAVIYNATQLDSSFLPEFSKRTNTFVFLSNSDNVYKGFYDFLRLAEYFSNIPGFSDLEFKSIGRLPKCFTGSAPNNFTHLGLLPKESVRDIFLASRYYLHASLYESCSNALIESVKCGLVPFVRNSSSNPEIIGDSRLLYDSHDELVRKFLSVYFQGCQGLSDLGFHYSLPSMKQCCDHYLSFCQSL